MASRLEPAFPLGPVAGPSSHRVQSSQLGQPFTAPKRNLKQKCLGKSGFLGVVNDWASCIFPRDLRSVIHPETNGPKGTLDLVEAQRPTVASHVPFAMNYSPSPWSCTEPRF